MISPDKMYYVKEETPLTYFKVLKVLMVIWIISSLLQMIGAPNAMSIVEHAIVVILSIGALANFSDMKWTGVKFVYVLLAFLSIDNLGGAIIYGSMGYDITQPLAAGIGDGLMFYATYVYFQKRRPLFTPFNQERSAVRTTDTGRTATSKNAQRGKPVNSAAASDIDKLVAQAFDSAQGMPDGDKMLYELEFHFMPKMFFEDPAKFADSFSNKTGIWVLFKKLTNHSYPVKDFSVNRADISQSTHALILGFPEPGSMPLCRSIVAIYNSIHPEQSKYYTIEKSFTGYCLCSVEENGSRSNYGMCSGEMGYEDAILHYSRTHSEKMPTSDF